ncbi:MAG: PA14 domain-containing protein [Verrucomicrobiota bacterium]
MSQQPLLAAGLAAALAWIPVALHAREPTAALKESLQARANNGEPVARQSAQVNRRPIQTWNCEGKTTELTFKAGGPVAIPADGVLYLTVVYLDEGYGKLRVQVIGKDGKTSRPDRFLGLTRTDSGKLVAAQMRVCGIQSAGAGEVAVRIGLEQPKDSVLRIEEVVLQETPFNNPKFAYVISDPWQGPYVGRTLKPLDNTTLKGKVMVGYQGWFRTPNDPEGKGWHHWGNVQDGSFTTDMWPDISQYPADCLEKAADVRLKSGKQGYLFSSAWPGVADTHFRWMREHDIDGAFLQRFVSDNFNSISGGPEWVPANVRAAANREGRIWAVEYDVSGYADAKLLETLKKDWMWFVDTFGVLQDSNYAREGGKPVVFLWGLPFPDRHFSPETANAVVDFFKNDPKYGGNYVIGGIPGNSRKLTPPWQEHVTRYDCVLLWMSQSYAEDIADFKKLDIAYYAHVKPGFSWANLKHLPTGDATIAFEPRDAGRYYWNRLTQVAKSGADRLFVGMFDEYDEGTAIMPMSDDAPPTPVRPGVAATFYNGPKASEQGEFVRLPSTEIVLGGAPPTRKTSAENFCVHMGGQIAFPAAGAYLFSVEGAAGDDVELSLNGKKVLARNNLLGAVHAAAAVTAAAGEVMPYRLNYRHGTAPGTLRLMWEFPGTARQQVPAAALRDAWGRFLSNEGRPSDWWLTLTRRGKGLIQGTRSVAAPMP